MAGLALAGHAQGAPLRQDAPSPVHWRTTCIECPLDVFHLGEHALRLDSTGRPHVVYASDQLYYAVWDGAAWQVEVIDATPGADDRTYQSGAALVLDEEQTPRIAYFSRDNRALKYAVRTPQGWRSEEIERTPPHRWMSRGVSLVTSTDDTGATRVWIAYTNYGVLRLAAQTASGWELTTIDNSGWSEENVALALDSDGRPHISYFYYTGAGGPDLRYARWDGSEWRIEAVDIPGRVGYGNTMALDADGHAHIAYIEYDWVDAELRYAHNKDGLWRYERVDSAIWWIGTSLALDDSGAPHISYTAADSSVRYANLAATGWQTTTVSANGWASALTLDAAAQPHVIFFGWAAPGLVYVHRVAASWQQSTIAVMANVGGHLAAAAGQAGDLHLAYTDSTNNLLKYAVRPAANTPDGWQLTVVDAVAGEAYTSLALEPEGAPQLSYYAGHDLRRARLTPAGWVTETVTTATGRGRATALAIDAAGTAYLATCTGDPGEILLAAETADGWVLTPVARGGCRSAALMLDAAGEPLISYVDGSQALRVARHTPAGWTNTPLAAAGRVGDGTALLRSPNDEPLIVFYALEHDAILLAHADGAGWMLETVAAGGDAGETPAVASTGSQPPAVAFYDDAGLLRWATPGADGWRTATLASGWRVGLNPAVLVEPGFVHVCYHDGTYRDLKCAVGTFNANFLPIVASAAP